MPSATHIRFIRNQAAVDYATTDDTVTIQRTDVDHYELTYTTANTESGVPNIYTICTDDMGVFRWFRSIIGLLEADIEPFPQIQLDFPSAPSIMIDTCRIGEHYHTILDALELWLDDGEEVAPPKTPTRPTQPVAPLAPPRRPRHHMFFDIGDDYE